jgi:hypothetical protein
VCLHGASADAIERIHAGVVLTGLGHQIEREADVFAASFLMPEWLFGPRCLLPRPTLADLEALGDELGTSQWATARRFAELAAAPCALAECRDSIVIARAARLLCPFGEEDISMSNNKKAVDNASATIARATLTDAQKVTVAQDIVSTAQKSPLWATATDLQTAAKVWSQTTSDLAANATTVVGQRSALATSEAKQRSLRRAWMAAKKQVLSTADVLCAGSADDLKGLGLDVKNHASLGALPVPVDLGTKPGTVTGQVVFSWSRGVARHGFLVQHATDVTNAATYSPFIPCTKTKLTLSGVPSGSSVSFRVCAIDPSSATDQTAWSAWVAGTAK